MATIRKRGSSWQVQVRKNGHPWISRTFKHHNDAKTWAGQIEAEADRHGLPPTIREMHRITVGALIERYRDTIAPKKRGCAVDTITLNALLRTRFSQFSIPELSPTVFATHRDQRLKKVKPATIRRELSLLQHVFEVARREWGVHLPTNPLSSVKKPDPGLPRDRRLEDGELEALKEGCARCRNHLIKPLMELAIETAMRRGELLNIHLNHLDLDKHTLHIPHTKNGHPRSIPLTGRAIEIIKTIEPGEDGRLFPMSPVAVRQGDVPPTVEIRSAGIAS